MTQKMLGGNLYDKYNAKSAIALHLMRGFLQAFDDLAGKVPVGRALEAGCGEGELIRRLFHKGWQTVAFDVSEEIVEEAKRRDKLTSANTDFFVADLDNATVESADLVVCCEVLEHLERPQQALTRLAMASPLAIFSVPNEPLWRLLNMARGAYLSDFGNTPGHHQHWSKARFISLLTAEYEVLEVKSPLPWTMALCHSHRFAKRGLGVGFANRTASIVTEDVPDG